MIRFTGISVYPEDDNSGIPDFHLCAVNLSEQTHPAIVLTKEHLNTFQGRLRGGDRHRAVRDGGLYVRATQLPIGYFDDSVMGQIQGDKFHRGLIDLDGVFTYVSRPRPTADRGARSWAVLVHVAFAGAIRRSIQPPDGRQGLLHLRWLQDSYQEKTGRWWLRRGNQLGRSETQNPSASTRNHVLE